MNQVQLLRLLVGLAVVLSPAWTTPAGQPPDSRVNLQSGNIEIADPVWQGGQYDVRHVINLGTAKDPEVSIVSEHPANDLAPRIAIGPAGDTWIVWWREGATDHVLSRKRRYSDGSWSDEMTLSDPGEHSRNPAIVNDGANAWVAYEFDSGDGTTGIAANIVVDDSDPVPSRTIVATTDFGGVGVRIHAVTGHLWVSWVDSGSEVGWSEYDYISETWSLAQFESYAADDIAVARSRIKSMVVGN